MELLRADGLDGGYARTVAGWPVAPAEVVMWCGRKDFPVPGEVVAGWRDAADVEAYVLHDGRDPVAYGELWLDAEESEVELARVIVAPAARGRGIGRRFVARLTVRARQTGLRDVCMRVHPGNDRALRCYRAAGFAPVPAELAAEWNAPQPVADVWLRHVGPPAVQA